MNLILQQQQQIQAQLMQQAQMNDRKLQVNVQNNTNIVNYMHQTGVNFNPIGGNAGNMNFATTVFH